MEGWSSPDQESQPPDSEPEVDEQGGDVGLPGPEPGEAGQSAGWYDYAGGLRFHDGEDWTDHLAPPVPKGRTLPELILAIAGGVLIAWFIVWLGAQIDNEHIYWPVKFVVDELPQGFR